MAGVKLNLHLHARQRLAFESEATEILYGGAAGGGKSAFMRIASVIWCAEIPGLQVYLFRRIRDDLVKNHMEGPNGYRAMLAPWAAAKFVTIVQDEIRFWNGSRIYLCHCKDEKDRFQYQGAEMHVLLIDELTHFTEKIYRFLRGRVRMIGVDVPKKWSGRFPRIVCGSNPGNIGHQWVKKSWIDGAHDLETRRMPKSDGGMLRQFISARIEDNPSLLIDDPDYEVRLEGLGSKALVDAMRHGDWDVIDGAFFDCWSPRRHVVRPFELPRYWLKFRAADWGSAKPFAVGWWAVVSDDYHHQDGHVLPRGALVCYREWYGCRVDAAGTPEPNVGLKLTVEEVARGIKEREAGEGVDAAASVIDPATFAQDGGPSIAERLFVAGVAFRPADNTRVAKVGAMGGWDLVRARLIGDGDGRPMLYLFSTCVHGIRTLPAMQHDEGRPEDIQTDAEDHWADMCRYACASRPWVRPAPSSRPKEIVPQPMRFDDAIAAAQRSDRARRSQMSRI